MGVRTRAALVLGTSVVTGACSALVDLSGLQGGAAAPVVDAGVASSDAAGAADAREASAPIPDGGDAAPADPCASTTHAVCADFDRGDLLAGGWTAIDRAPVGSIALDTARSASPPASLLATLPRRDTGAEARNTIYWAKTSGWRRVRLAMDVMVEGASFLFGDRSPSVALLYYYSPTVTTGVNLFVDGTSSASSVESLPDTERYFAVPNLKRDAWSHVVLDFDPLAGLYTWEIDGVQGKKVFPPVPAPGGAFTMSATIGLLAYGAPMPALRVRYDNVTVDLP